MSYVKLLQSTFPYRNVVPTTSAHTHPVLVMVYCFGRATTRPLRLRRLYSDGVLKGVKGYGNFGWGRDYLVSRTTRKRLYVNMPCAIIPFHFDAFSLLGYDAWCVGSWLPTFRDSLLGYRGKWRRLYFPWEPITAHTMPYVITYPPVPGIRLGNIDRWRWNRQAAPRRLQPTDHPTTRNIPEERRPPLQRHGSLRSTLRPPRGNRTHERPDQLLPSLPERAPVETLKTQSLPPILFKRTLTPWTRASHLLQLPQLKTSNPVEGSKGEKNRYKLASATEGLN
jgi:hypothetical protein